MLRKWLNTRMLGLLLAAASAAITAAPASAGTYNVASCTKSPTHSLAGWASEETAGQINGLPYFYDNGDCSLNGVYRRFELNGVTGGAYDALTFKAPADTWIDQATLYQSINPLVGGAYDAVYAELEDGSRRTLASYVGNTNTTVGDTTYAMPSSGSHAIRLRTELGCQATVSWCGGELNWVYGNVWELKGSVIRLVDPYLPAMGTPTGAGWQDAPADGVSPLQYALTDRGSGVESVHFLVDGIEQAVNSSSCSSGSLVPCPKQSTGEFSLDTTRLSEGPHTIALTASDYSGNATAAADQQKTITVRRAPQPASDQPVTTSDPSANGGGSPAVGDQINGNAGSWSGSDNTYTYQWQRCDADGLNCVPIDGATGLDYTATLQDIGHTLELCVTATNSGGAVTSCSAPTPVVIATHPVSPSPTDGSHDSATPATPNSAGAPHTVGSGSVTSGSRGTPNGSPAADRVVLSAVANNRSSTLKVKYGKRVVISGRLVAPGGQPIVNALLTVQKQTAVPGASMADAAHVTTGPDGRFSYRAPAGPSRTIRVGYRAYSGDAFFADTTDVHLVVTAGVTMKATPKKVRNRHVTVFKGRLLGKPIPRRGVVVDLQVFFRKQWRTFAAPRTNRKGVYKFKYRFMAGAATWKFRARVRKDTSYPYTLGYSKKPVRVKVVG